MVDDSEDGVVSLAFGELGNQVHCHFFERKLFGGGREWEQRNFLLVGEVFVLLADGASFYKVSYPPVHSRPPEVTRDFLNCLISAWVSSHWGVMVVSNHILSELVMR